MKKIIVPLLFLIVVSSSPAYGHKLISHDDSHRDFDSALVIPDHKISWAIYENLGINEAKFYSFDAKKGDLFYTSIVIPKIEGLEEYSPTLVLVSPQKVQNDNNSYGTHSNTEKFLYEGNFPGREFYEPFGQVTYWERQEIKTEIPEDGRYFIIVTDEKNQIGKYSLAIGTIEDFSGENMFLILPKSWFETKLFVNDYASIVISFFILIALPITLSMIFIKKRKRKLKRFS
ncbi:MAG: hypothetical protein OEM28_03850 [Nitrosopumilus sp.]|nr:hypothetical protein [Nitrosopumilus sp.]MDH3487584.1 hypothetical protein [Nitrosopumilus sp.]